MPWDNWGGTVSSFLTWVLSGFSSLWAVGQRSLLVPHYVYLSTKYLIKWQLAILWWVAHSQPMGQRDHWQDGSHSLWKTSYLSGIQRLLLFLIIRSKSIGLAHTQGKGIIQEYEYQELRSLEITSEATDHVRVLVWITGLLLMIFTKMRKTTLGASLVGQSGMN
jgi:hypothetical protein